MALLWVKSGYGKRNLISNDSLNSHFEDLETRNLSVTVFWYFPKWEVPLYRIKAAWIRNLTKFVKFLKEKHGNLATDKNCQLPEHFCLYGIRFTLAVVFLSTGIAAISGICPNR
mgnify:FL=1